MSKAGYYAWRDRKRSGRARQDEELRADIHAFHLRSAGTYGAPRVHVDLQSVGLRVSRKRVARLMREEDLVGKKRHASRRTTAAAPFYGVSPNVLGGNFYPLFPNRAWAADITYLPTGEGFLYLAIVLDLCSRRVVGWSMSNQINAALVLAALEAAVTSRKPKKGLIVHTDRGSQYACREYRAYLDSHGIEPSMSAKGNCWDNAVAESFFATLKTEAGPRSWPTRAQARAAIFEYIETWYNPIRRHSTNGQLSPMQYERSRNVA